MTIDPTATRWPMAIALILTLATAAAVFAPASAASLTQKDIQILAKAIGFLEPAPSGTGTVAIVYEPSDAASKQDAEAIAGYFGDGLKAGNSILKAKIVEAGQSGSGGYVALVAASGARLDQVAAAARAQHAPCITADVAAVQAGQCVMAVRSEPRVEILINRAAAASSNVTFGSAFLLMARAI